MNLKFKICILICLMYLVSCATLKESPHRIVGDVIDDILNNPQKLYNLYEFYPELKCDTSIYDLTKDSANLLEVIHNIEVLRSNIKNVQIGVYFEDSLRIVNFNQKYFNNNYIKDKNEIINIGLKNNKLGVDIFFVVKNRKYYIFDIKGFVFKIL